MKVINRYLLILLISGFSVFVIPQNNQTILSPKETGRTKGFDVVFAVDVSPGMTEKKYVKLLENVVISAHNTFQNSFKINTSNNYYLITFAKRAKLFETSSINKDFMLKELKNQLSKNRCSTIYLINGLSKVFDLVDDSFPQKIGIVFFISNGNSRNSNLDASRKELKQTILSLKRNGFTVFSIYLPTGSLNCKDCMVMVSEWSQTPPYIMNEVNEIQGKMDHLLDIALKIEYSSPIMRSEFDKIKMDLENTANMVKNKELEIANLKSQIESRKNAKKSFRNDSEEIQANNQGSSSWVILLACLLTAFIISLIFYLKNRWPFIYPGRRKLRDGADREPINPILINFSNNKSKKNHWLPEFPNACRCKNRIDIREIVAFESIREIIRTGKKRSTVKWLDLCCGNGNILLQVKKSMGRSATQIEYFGFDIDKNNIDECEKIIHLEELDKCLAGINLDVVNLDTSPIPGDNKFDIITLLNVMHEINPFGIYPLLKNALQRCKRNGVLLIVDMINLPHLEWSAITWSGNTLADLLSYFIKDENIICLDQTLTIPTYQRAVDIFSLKLNRKDIDEGIFFNWESKKEENKRKKIIIHCLEKKKQMLSQQLKRIYIEREHIVSSKEDWESKISKILWEYWAVCESPSSFILKR